MTRQRLFDTGYLALLWLVMVVVLFRLRPLWPVIETRYVAVAWEMWLRHDFLVPYLNGAPYSHKPPLLFWAIHLGWWLFGINSWWPRVVPSLFSFGALAFALQIGRLLWPERREIGAFLPFMLFGALLWTFYMTFVMFDLLVTFSAVVGMYGLVHALLRKRLTGFLLFGLGIGLGILSKGPVILVVLLPVALAAPWWGRGSGQSWWTWYAGIAGAFLLGVLIALAWALPAAQSGGEAYAEALLWKQTANRVVQSFAHRQPWWWYLPLLPFLLFPWPWLPSMWQAARQLDFQDRGVRFCLAWSMLPLVIFSMISGKQVHYLLPIFPAFLLLASILAGNVAFKPRDFLPQVFLFCGLAAVWLVLPFLSARLKLPSWVQELSPVYGLALLLFCLVFIVLARRWRGLGVKAMTTMTILAVVVLQAGILDGGARFYDIRPLSSFLAQVQEKGYPIANTAKYEGQYQFLGRLRQPLEVISPYEVSSWLAAHPNGRVIRYFRQWPEAIEQQVEFKQPYRGQYAVVVSASTP